jgi:SAM-dependent MidA family methyltransferase
MLSFLSSRLVYGSLRFVIIERNPHIRAHQQQLLRQHASRILWLDTIDALQEPVTGCFLSNELLDAFPVRLVQMDSVFEEVFVGEHRNEFVEIGRPCSVEVERYLAAYAPGLPSAFRAGDRTEVNLQIWPWIESVSAKLAEGFVLTIDYGYPAPDYYCAERNRGTLLCYSGHRISEDPYQNVGEQDITAHVNFTSLKRWGEDVGLRTIGFCPQGPYLIALGLDEVLPELEPESDSFASARIRNLILPEGMGESHKVLMQYKGERALNLRGFSLRNQAKLLM